MIEFKTWLPQIVGYCEFIVNDIKLRQAWVKHDFSETSVTDFDELYEQLFDDLDADYFSHNLREQLPNSEQMATSVANFITSLHEFDRARNENSELLDPTTALDSGQWKPVRSSALAVLNAAKWEAGNN